MLKLKILKLGTLILVGAIIGLGFGFGILLPKYQNSFDRIHKGHIGYLAPENPDVSDNYERCSDKLPVGFYHSTAPYIYKGGKPAFKKYIQDNFSGKEYTDDGFLNFRFLIDCKGEIGDYEINPLNTELEISTLNKDLVNELSKLTLRKENWNALKTREIRDLYMYLIYKIENGEVVEILP